MVREGRYQRYTGGPFREGGISTKLFPIGKQEASKERKVVHGKESYPRQARQETPLTKAENFLERILQGWPNYVQAAVPQTPLTLELDDGPLLEGGRETLWGYHQ